MSVSVAAEAGETAPTKTRRYFVMNKDQFKGSWHQLKGEVKKKWDQFTDNDLLEAEGDYDKFLGVVQKRYGDRKEEVKRWVDEWWDRNGAGSRKGESRIPPQP
jgi:uncharacterized protein YjbJ (UPF0337 family)